MNKIRKRDTGEKGNRGEFGTIRRGEAELAVTDGPTVRAESEDEHTGPSRRVPTWGVARAEHKVELVNRRLEREGFTERFILDREDGPIEHRSPNRYEVDEYNFDPGKIYAFQYSELTLNRPLISLEGWQFAAALDRVPGTEEFMMRAAPRHDFGGWRPEPGRCDHCRKYRDRNTTYLVTHPSIGETMQVGASCMEAFLGIKPKGLWTLGTGMNDLYPDDEPAPLSSMQVEDNRELIAKSLVASNMGKRYVSKTRAMEWGAQSTADRIRDLFGSDPYRKLTPEMRAERDQAQQELQEVLASDLVDQVISAGTSVGTDSDYGRNLTTALEAGFATEKMEGTVISAVAVYGRQQREAAKEQSKVDRVESAAKGFVAPVKTRLRDVPATVTNVYESTRPRFAYPYGDEPFQIITLRDAEGHEIVWKTGAIQPVEPGAEVVMTGTVKAHTQYQSVDQTEISRAKFELPVEVGGDGFPIEGAPYSPNALGRTGKKLAGEKVRVEESIERAGDWILYGRTTSNHRVSWETDQGIESGAILELDGRIADVMDAGVKTARIETS